MELNLKEVQQMDPKQIFEFLLSNITRIYKQYSYLYLSNEKYEILVLKEIVSSKEKYTGSIPYDKFLEKQIHFMLSQITAQLLQNEEDAMEIISNYINCKFIRINSVEEALKNLKKLNAFLESYNYMPNPDIIVELINKNIKFSKTIKLIFEKYRLPILNGKSEEIFNNDFLCLIIHTYCMLNNIKIKEESEVLSQDTSELETYSTDSTRLYLQEIKKIPLLSIEQEKELAKKAKAGDEESRKKFLESNLRLVVIIAKRFLNRGMPFLDLIQEGNLGLIKALDKYDVQKGFRFSTYATWWIRESIKRALANKSRNIRIPVQLYEQIGVYRSVVMTLENKLNRTPTIREIATEMGVPISKVKTLQNAQVDTISLQTTIIGDEDYTELEDFIPADEETPEDKFLMKNLPFELEKLFDSCNLTSREKEVLMLRYGFDGQEPMTLNEIGIKYKLTRERIRQIEAKAIKKIINSNNIKDFAIYMQSPTSSLERLEKMREEYLQPKIKVQKRIKKRVK